jgi:hypothetical protein
MSGSCYDWQNVLNFAGNSDEQFYAGQCQYFGAQTVLPAWLGWFIVAAFGASELQKRSVAAKRSGCAGTWSTGVTLAGHGCATQFT